MRTIRLTTMWVLLMAAAQLSAQKQYIYADSVNFKAGAEAEIVVRMDFDTDEAVSAWNFRMKLPDGVELANTENPASSCILSEEMYDADKFSNSSESMFQVLPMSDGTLLFLFLNGESGVFNSYEPLKSTHCELVRVTVKSDITLLAEPAITHVCILNQNHSPLVTNGKDLRHDDPNTIYIDDTEALVGTEFTLSVKMHNEIDIEGFGFDLILPIGLMVVTDEEGNPVASLSEKRTTAIRTNTFSAVMRNNSYNDVLRVVAASSNGSAITAGDGEVCTVRVRVGTGLKEGEYTAFLRNITLADTEARSHESEDGSFTVKVLALGVGDANGDGKTNVADLTAIAHHVLGNTPNGFSEKAADANQDGQVNVADYIAVAHLLLYGKIEAPAGTRADNVGEGPVPALIEGTDISQFDNTVYMAPVSATAGEEVVLSVRMKNAVDAEGFQFTLTLPEGVSVVRDEEGLAEACLSTERTTPARTNTFATSLQPDGSLRVMAASTNSSAIGAGDGEVCTVRIKVEADMAAGDYALLLSDVAISDTQAKSHDVDQVEVMLSVSDILGISEIANRKFVNSKCYDLQGRKIVNRKSVNRKSTKGLYISDGRKHLF